MVSLRQDRAYQAELVEDYIGQHSGNGLSSSIELDTETHLILLFLADHYHETPRQALMRWVKNAIDTELNKKPCTCDGWFLVCDRPACQAALEEECKLEDAKALRVAEDYWGIKHLPWMDPNQGWEFDADLAYVKAGEGKLDLDSILDELED